MGLSFWGYFFGHLTIFFLNLLQPYFVVFFLIIVIVWLCSIILPFFFKKRENIECR